MPKDKLLALALAAWAALVVALSVKSVCEPTDRSTYPCFEAGTRCWWREGNLYTMEDCGHEYRYAPAFAVGLTPLAVLPTWLLAAETTPVRPVVPFTQVTAPASTVAALSHSELKTT